MNSSQIRLDQLLAERGLAENRTQAQRLIMAHQVLINDVPATKAGMFVRPNDPNLRLRVKRKEHPYVSRGGVKLAHALKEFGIDPKGKTALDIGASTGGFCDVLLRNGVARIHAVDVGKYQMDWRIRSRPEIHLLEGVNARELVFDQIGEKVDLITVDVSFISVTKILPALLAFAHEETDWITLIKPQFEVGKGKVGKGGIVRDDALRGETVEAVCRALESHGLRRVKLLESPIQGVDGNREFLSHWKSGFGSLQ